MTPAAVTGDAVIPPEVAGTAVSGLGSNDTGEPIFLSSPGLQRGSEEEICGGCLKTVPWRVSSSQVT